jgi:hypothetical protein
MRLSFAALLAALSVVAGGCGGSQAASTESAATMLKPGALVYWETVSDPDSDQWQQVEELLKRFPDGDRWLRTLREDFESDTKVTWEDLRKALGDETVVAVYAQGKEPAVVGVTKPDDLEAANEVVRKLNDSAPDDEVVSRVVDDWLVVSDKDESIDAALATSGERSLGDEESFNDRLGELPEDALSRVYVDVAAAVEQFMPQLGEEERQALGALNLDDIDFAGAWARAEDDGASLAGVASGSGLEQSFGGPPFTSELLARVPDDAIAFLTFRGEAATEQLNQLKGNALFRMGAREVEKELGVTIDELVQLFEGEVALYVRRGVLIPEVTLMVDADDDQAAHASADRVLRSVARRYGAEVTEDGDVTTANFDGVTVNLGTVDGAVVLSTSRKALSDLEAGGAKLADSDAFEDALEAAEVPDAYTGLAYVDLADAIELVMGYVGIAEGDVPPEVGRNLEPLRSFVAYGTAEGDSAEVRAFLGIE